ncbi:unnamed protein product [Closterium sp. Naga37s-1]|nr:unnamed protein product [Closterium sp. Naga37s-1]
MAGNIRLQRRLQRKAKARRQQLSYRTIRSAFLVAALCSVTYAWVIFLKGSRPYVLVMGSVHVRPCVDELNSSSPFEPTQITLLSSHSPPPLPLTMPPQWWWGLSTGDHPELIKARFASRAREPATLWDNPVKGKWQQCVRPSPAYAEAPLYESTGYLQVFLDGGLNQQRISICNAVAVARLLNATLLIPHFQINPVWLDDSQFEDIFDVEHFMRYLQRDVLIVRQLPHKYRWSTREFYSTGVHQNRIKFAPMHASPEWYLKNVLPKLQRHGVVAIAPFTHRLAFDGLPPDVQRLRCRVNFHALRFVEPVRRLGRILVERLRDPNRRHVKRGVLFGKGGDVSSYGGKGKVGGIGEGAAEGEKTAAAKEAEDESEKAAEMAAAKAAEMVEQLQEEARGGAGAGAGAGVGDGRERAEVVSEGREETKETFKEAIAGEGEGKGGREGEEGVGGGDVSGAAGVRVIEDGKGLSGISTRADGDGDGDGDAGGGGDAGGLQQGSKGGIEAVEEDEEGEEGEGEAEGGGKRRLLQESRGGVGGGVSVAKGGGGKGGGRRGGGAGVGRMGEEDSEEGSEGAFWSEDGLIDEAARERRALRAGREERVVPLRAGNVTAGSTTAGNGSAGNGSAGNSSGVGKVEDMVAHSACDYGETWAEREALSKYREYAWLGRVDKLRFSSDELRLAGKCPLTPEEVGLVLAALGFSAKTRLYVATYQVYGGEKRIAPLRRLFPWLEDKTSLATEEELRPFLGKASLLAALDFYVSRYSDVFVSASLGNMHNVMAAHRAYFGGLKTINFNGTLLATLLAAPPNTLNWNEFVRAVRIGHRSRMGKIKPRRAGQSIYTYPAPDCLCPIDVPPSQPATRTVTRYKKAAEGRRRLRLLTTLQSLYSFLRVLIAASLMARPLITARLHGSTGGGPQALQIDVKESLAAALGAAAALTGNLASGTSRARVLKLYATLSLMACVAALLPLLTGPLVYPVCSVSTLLFNWYSMPLPSCLPGPLCLCPLV